MKDSYYFPHDFNAHNDPKIIRLAMAGWDLVGLYWSVIEMMHEQGGWLSTDTEPLAFALRTQSERIATLIDFPCVFIKDGNKFTSQRVLDNLAVRQQKSDKARKSAQVLWDKRDTKHANAERTHSDGNAMAMLRKERKGKESIALALRAETPASDHKVFVDWWCLEYKTKFGSPYAFSGGKDGKIIRELLDTFGMEELKRRAVAFMDSGDDFVNKAGHTIGVFKSQINKLNSFTTAPLPC